MEGGELPVVRVEGGVVDAFGSPSTRAEENIDGFGREGAEMKECKKEEKVVVFGIVDEGYDLRVRIYLVVVETVLGVGLDFFAHPVSPLRRWGEVLGDAYLGESRVRGR